MSSELGELRERYGFIFESLDKNKASTAERPAQFAQPPKTAQFMDMMRGQPVRDMNIARPMVMVGGANAATNVAEAGTNNASMNGVGTVTGANSAMVGVNGVSPATMGGMNGMSPNLTTGVSSKPDMVGGGRTAAGLHTALVEADNAAAMVADQDEEVKRVKNRNYRSLSCLLIAGILGMIIGSSVVLILVYTGTIAKKTEVITKTEIVQSHCMTCDCEEKTEAMTTNTTNTTTVTKPVDNATVTEVTNSANATKVMDKEDI